MSTLITPDLVSLDEDLGPDRPDVIRALADRIAASGRASDAEGLYADALAREAKTATGVPGGIAIPHCRSEHVLEPTLGFARLPRGIDWGAKDGPADLVFFIAAPAGADNTHLAILSTLARSLVRKDFRESLRSASSREELVALVEAVVSGERPGSSPAQAGVVGSSSRTTTQAAAPSAAPDTDARADAAPAHKPKLVAVTACPTGIAHTFMAADSLSQAAEDAGVELHVEPQGSGSVTPLDPAIIRDADAVIFAVDVDVRDRARFAGKPVIQSPVKRGIDEPAELIREAVAASTDPNARRVPAAGGADESAASDRTEGLGGRMKRVLLTGVSYMIPFVAGGGLLIALGFLLGSYEITSFADKMVLENSLWNLPTEIPEHAPLGALGAYLGAVAFKIGALSMGFLVPALAGYIAYGMADRPGIAPGFVAGAVAGFMGAGFLGGIVGGLLAGAVASWLGSRRFPRAVASLMPVVVIPLVASIVASGLMLLVLGGPIAALTKGLNDWLSSMSGTSAVLLGVILGLMMCFDLGGPVNKVAYSFAVAALGTAAPGQTAPLLIMAAVMASGMVPPLALALATAVRPALFTPVERENGKSAWLLGAVFVSEGAIPFAAADPLRVIPATMLGGAVTGALSMGLGAMSRAPHGGAVVFFAMDGTALQFLLSVLAGTVVSAVAVIVLKSLGRKRATTDAPAEALEPAGV
ncbi:fructose-specific PTS transporter subunit EIIC [Falsarthrobacter nasiphocae]|uniref:PTS system fructose-specific IIC component n=1 Tax=Falsarthrobacter nasiphocae TaxID=189863 RepID=A0AAE3YEW4_9MICC|nr:fructose-specific PTS transporter subunit EIIC [Falsarthrobacter nasiphocae]MDR6891945.1 PTS system fructose-specific IIC component [Falsarthrobacter nasiphocae]